MTRLSLHLFALMLGLGLALSASAQTLQAAAPPAAFEKSFAGTINGTLRVQMKLTRQSNKLSGSYFYEKTKIPIKLSGTISDEGYFQIEELDAQNIPAAYFIGAFTRDGSLVGFWMKDWLKPQKLAFQLQENGLPGAPHKYETIAANVPGDQGSAQILLIDGTVVAFVYENVGGNAHICTLTVDRSGSEGEVIWQQTPTASPTVTTITFSKEYLAIDEGSATITIRAKPQSYELSFSGNFRYFCGARAGLPTKVLLTKTAKGWIGKAQN